MPSCLFAEVVLKDYHGGTNPILIILALALVIVLILMAIGMSLYRVYRGIQFNRICSNSKMSSHEIGTLRTFLRRMHIKEPLDVVTKKSRFDLFMNRVAHYYEKISLSEEDLHREQSVFAAMREKLNLPHTFKKKRLFTSRALPRDYPLSVLVKDPLTLNVFHFQSSVLDNNELYLGITPPSDELRAELDIGGRVEIALSFIRERDAEYLWESHLIRPVDYPETMWYIAHSPILTRGTIQEPVNHPALIMLQQSDDEGRVDEFNVTLYNLTNTGCTFRCDDARHPFDTGPRVLISFELPNGSFTLRGSVVNIIKRKGEFLYRIQFEKLKDEDNISLLRFMLDQQKERKRKHAEPALEVAGV